jgi:hypothetical protein
MKQTAVEWLYKALLLDEDNPNYNQRVFNQAKEMEKEQMKWFIQVGYYAHSQGHQKTDELYEYWINNFKSQ